MNNETTITTTFLHFIKLYVKEYNLKSISFHISFELQMYSPTLFSSKHNSKHN